MQLRRILSTLALIAMTGAAHAEDGPRYRVTEWLAAPDGPWDYARVDLDKRRLYIARRVSVTAIDLDGGHKVSSLGKIFRGHAVIPIDGGDRLLVTSGGDNTLRLLNAADGSEIKSVTVGEKPDSAVYDAARRQVLVVNSDGGSVSVVDVATMRVTRTIPVKPGLEYSAMTADRTLFINNAESNELEVVDVARARTGTPIALPGCEDPSGLGLDGKHNRLISVCKNGKAMIVDVRTRTVTDTVEIGRGPDAVIIDEQRQLAFVPCGIDGVLDVLSLASPERVTRVGRIQTEVGAKTGALDSRTGVIYLPTGRMAPKEKPEDLPQTIPGSFHVLVVRPQ